MGILSERLPGVSIGRKLLRLAALGRGEGGTRRLPGEVTPGDFSMSPEICCSIFGGDRGTVRFGMTLSSMPEVENLRSI
jgi:hypothetical protein